MGPLKVKAQKKWTSRWRVNHSQAQAKAKVKTKASFWNISCFEDGVHAFFHFTGFSTSLSGIDMHIVFLKNLLSLDSLPETANNELYHIKQKWIQWGMSLMSEALCRPPLPFERPSSIGLLAEGSSFNILRPFSQVSASIASLMNAFWLGQEARLHNALTFLCCLLSHSSVVLPFPISWICFLHLFLVD